MTKDADKEILTDDLKDVNFEGALKELEEIVGKLENGELELETCLQSFERGTKLLSFCEGKLNETARKLEILRKTGDNKAEFQAFDTEA